MVEDYPSSSSLSNVVVQNMCLKDLNGLLAQHNKSTIDYDLPTITEDFESLSEIPTVIEDELSIRICQEDLEAINKLNDDQKLAFDAIVRFLSDMSPLSFLLMVLWVPERHIYIVHCLQGCE